jgi:hypothetical protein
LLKWIVTIKALSLYPKTNLTGKVKTPYIAVYNIFPFFLRVFTSFELLGASQQIDIAHNLICQLAIKGFDKLAFHGFFSISPNYASR